MAWLNATPEVELQKGETKRETKSRQQVLLAGDIEPEMPDLAWGKYLIDYLLEVGPVMAAGMGSAPITFTEIRNWREEIGLRLNSWEVRTLRRLSLEYNSESQLATKPDREPPFKTLDAARLKNAQLERDIDNALD
jgi:hypothetical protein